MAAEFSHSPEAFRYSNERGGRAMSGSALARAIALALLLLGAIGCDSPQPAAEDQDSAAEDRPQRLARRYLPFEPEWISERRIPTQPQRTPQMVIWEVSEFDPRVAATADQQKAADEFVLDDVQLDPERPEYLMYYPDPEGSDEDVLTGLMFLADAPESRGHQFAGPLAIWHYHTYTNARCWTHGGLLSTGMVDASGKCSMSGGVPIHRSPEMVHVWLIDHPRGPFSTGMTLPQDVLKAGLAKRRELHGF
jgi:hypothetical protein